MLGEFVLLMRIIRLSVMDIGLIIRVIMLVSSVYNTVLLDTTLHQPQPHPNASHVHPPAHPAHPQLPAKYANLLTSSSTTLVFQYALLLTY